jgi:hypothetical protein
MDEFDIIDIVHDAVEAANTGLVLYKKRSAKAEKNNHTTVRELGVNKLEYVNKAPAINVNIFIKQHPNGAPDIKKMKEVKRAVEEALNNIVPPHGRYWKSRIVWSEPFDEAKEGFDCINIRLEVITEL